jgi:hypothetical protein
LKKFSVLFVLHWSNIWCSVELVVSCDCSCSLLSHTLFSFQIFLKHNSKF